MMTDIYIDYWNGQDWLCMYGMVFENAGCDFATARRTMPKALVTNETVTFHGPPVRRYPQPKEGSK